MTPTVGHNKDTLKYNRWKTYTTGFRAMHNEPRTNITTKSMTKNGGAGTNVEMFSPRVTGEAVTGLCGVLYAHGGSELGLVLVLNQSHLRNPFQIVCGVDLHTGRMTMTSVQMVWTHSAQNETLKKSLLDNEHLSDMIDEAQHEAPTVG